MVAFGESELADPKLAFPLGESVGAFGESELPDPEAASAPRRMAPKSYPASQKKSNFPAERRRSVDISPVPRIVTPHSPFGELREKFPTGTAFPSRTKAAAHRRARRLKVHSAAAPRSE